MVKRKYHNILDKEWKIKYLYNTETMFFLLGWVQVPLANVQICDIQEIVTAVLTPLQSLQAKYSLL